MPVTQLLLTNKIKLVSQHTPEIHASHNPLVKTSTQLAYNYHPITYRFSLFFLYSTPQPPSLEPGEENNRGVRGGGRGRNVGRRGNRANQRASRPRRVDNMTRFMDLLDHYPPEISTFLQGQIHRCLIYNGDSEEFWLALRDVLLEN